MLEKWLIYAACVLAGGFFSVALTLVTCALFYKWLQGQVKQALSYVEGLNSRMEAIEVWMEAQVKSADMSARGAAGQAAKQENAQEMAEATEQGKAVLLSKLPPEGKKAALLALIEQHPRVALNVAQKLNRQFGISKFLGMSEASFMEEIAGVAAAALQKMKEKQAEAPPAAKTLPFYR